MAPLRLVKTQSSTDQLIESLRTRRVSTLIGLCHIERIAASSSDTDQLKFREPVTAAWKYYVDSNNFLNELRGLTRNYPFSSGCLNEARWLVLNDPATNRSWNVAWLVLTKVIEEDLIQKHANASAARPEMWGGRMPENDEATQLEACFAWEWTSAVEQMLQQWSTPPTTTGC